MAKMYFFLFNTNFSFSRKPYTSRDIGFLLSLITNPRLYVNFSPFFWTLNTIMLSPILSLLTVQARTNNRETRFLSVQHYMNYMSGVL